MPKPSTALTIPKPPDAMVSQAATLVADGEPFPAIRATLVESVPADVAEAALGAALIEIAESGQAVNRAFERGVAIQRLNTIYAEGRKADQLFAALGAEKERIKLLNLTAISEEDDDGMVSMVEVRETWGTVMGVLQEAVLAVADDMAPTLARRKSEKSIGVVLRKAIQKAFDAAIGAFGEQ